MSPSPLPPRSVLVGFLASGKTSLGRALAGAWGTGLADLDEILLAEEGAPTVREWLGTRGEPHFRARERALLEELQDREERVIATGSGTPAWGDNLDLLHRLGVVVFLHTPWETLLARLGTKEGVLPPDLPLEALHALYLRRLPYYLQADLTLAPGAGEPPEALALRLRMMLKESLPCAI